MGGAQRRFKSDLNVKKSKVDPPPSASTLSHMVGSKAQSDCSGIMARMRVHFGKCCGSIRSICSTVCPNCCPVSCLALAPVGSILCRGRRVGAHPQNNIAINRDAIICRAAVLLSLGRLRGSPPSSSETLLDVEGVLTSSSQRHQPCHGAAVLSPVGRFAAPPTAAASSSVGCPGGEL
jgi:hypothetical protein